jgi:hypothetical protein
MRLTVYLACARSQIVRGEGPKHDGGFLRSTSAADARGVVVLQVMAQAVLALVRRREHAH